MARTVEGCQRSKIIKEIKEQFELTGINNSVIDSLVEELYWQIIKLKECRQKIDESSIAVRFTQGEQDMLIQNPLIKTYNDLIKNQSTTVKTLLSVTGKGKKDDDLKDIMNMLNGGKKKKAVDK